MRLNQCCATCVRLEEEYCHEFHRKVPKAEAYKLGCTEKWFPTEEAKSKLKKYKRLFKAGKSFPLDDKAINWR